MSPFVKKFSGIEQLKNENLFKNYLLPDIIGNGPPKCRVFPAIRKERMDFYYNGGKLFSYHPGTGFSTHYKYASVIAYPTCDSDNCYLTESKLQSIKLITDFCQGYDRIKEYCSVFSGLESEGVSNLLNNFSFTNLHATNAVVVLDIEISLRNQDEERKQDRIDLLLFDTKSKTLRFYEAKTFLNNELRATIDAKPKIVGQIQRYESQLAASGAEILCQYQKQVNIFNNLFAGLILQPLPLPEQIDSTVGLLIFDFDNDQKKGRLEKNLEVLRTNYGIKVYPVGNQKEMNIGSIWKCLK